MISHSKVETYKNCGRQFKFRYIDGLKTLPNYDPDNPLVLGIALHSGIERNEKEALAEYAAFFPQITDQHIEEMMKLSALIDKCRKILHYEAFQGVHRTAC
jgi:ATP-dependent helicase/DNAse subunit B